MAESTFGIYLLTELDWDKGVRLDRNLHKGLFFERPYFVFNSEMWEELDLYLMLSSDSKDSLQQKVEGKELL